MYFTKLITGILFCILIGGCAIAETKPEVALEKYTSVKVSFAPDEILHCHGYGCRLRSYIYIEPENSITLAGFFRNVQSAESERIAIANAVGWLESHIGKIAGTDGDIKGTYKKLGDDQHDCVDESVNTTIYLLLMRDSGLIQYHDILQPQARFPILGGGLGPHQTAVIIEIETDHKYAVDSWFHDNGHPPEIVRFRKWFYGWKPR